MSPGDILSLMPLLRAAPVSDGSPHIGPGMRGNSTKKSSIKGSDTATMRVPCVMIWRNGRARPGWFTSISNAVISEVQSSRYPAVHISCEYRKWVSRMKYIRNTVTITSLRDFISISFNTAMMTSRAVPGCCPLMRP